MEEKQRCQAKIITRLYSVSPSAKERFYLRILLLNVKGATSYDDLKTFKGTTYDTFELSARERNLLIDDNEWINVLDEAVSTQTPAMIRQLFAYICIFNKPNNPDKLFNKYVEDMSEDTIDVADKVNEVLLRLKSIFDVHNQVLSNYNLPEPTNVSSENITETVDIDQLNENISNLNKEQKEAFNKVIDSIDNDGKLLFLDGPASTGKTYLYKVIIDYIKSIGKIVLPFATTGIAADLLSGAKTVHSGFKLPVPLYENSVSRIKEDSKEAILLSDASLILIDEVSMLSKYALNAIDEVLRRVTKNDNIFGGKTILLGGDFRQTANVVMRGTRNDIVETSIINSNLWKNVSIIRLSENMRSTGQEEFTEWLLKVGNGSTNDENDMVEIPERFIEKNSIVGSIFGKGPIDTLDETLHNKIILTSKNEDSVKLNTLIIDKVDGDLGTYTSIDTIVSEDINDHINYPMEFINKQQPSGMPPHILKLKIGTIVMLLRNLDQKSGLLNGTRMAVKEMHKHYIVCNTLTGVNKGNAAAIPRIDLAPSETTLPFVLKRRQFPIIPAFAMTIHKSQGQTFDEVGIYLSEPLFTHGQLYVALSRVKNSDNLKIYSPGNSNRKTKNVVYKELIG